MNISFQFKHKSLAVSLLLVASVVCQTAQAKSADVVAARNALNAENYAEALKMLKPLAEHGSRRAQVWLAQMYEKGEGVAKDDKEAMHWYEKACFNATAPVMVPALKDLDDSAYMRDPHAFVSDCQAKANQGDPHALTTLGFMYHHGKGVHQDYSKALELYTKAADLGHADALCHLGFMYNHGMGVKQDRAKALELYKQAAEKNCPAAFNDLGYMYVRGIAVPANYNEAVEMFKKAAALDDPHGMLNLGWMYLEGKGVDKDPLRAARLFEKAAAYGLAAGRYNLGYMYQEGLGVAQDYEKGSSLYQMAYAQGYTPTENDLGFMSKSNEAQFENKQTSQKFHWGQHNTDGTN
ncbi:MAG TPA: tetratricopeptide repeat protein [Chroococcales cyanobacterium]